MGGKRLTSIRALYGKTEDRYLDLVRHFPLRPLRSDDDLDAAIAAIDALLERPKLTAAEQDYLDVLSDLVETYEAEVILIHPVGDAGILRFLIEENDVTQAALATGAGIAESTISEVLSGKRRLNRSQIAKLARYFHLEPGVFLSEI